MTGESLKALTIRLAPLIFAAGLAHLGWQIVKHWDLVTLDFRFFWLAGEFWTTGRSPYDAAFAAQAADIFGVERGAIWYYTPNWFPLAALLSVPDAQSASRMWLFANAAMLLAGAALNVRAFQRFGLRSGVIDSGAAPFATFLFALPQRTLFFLLAGVVALSQAAGNTLHLGQCSMLVYAGLSLLFFGAAHDRRALAAAGLAIVMLKPQIGVLVCAGLVFTAFGRQTIAIAAAISVAAAIPAFVITPPGDLVSAFAAGVAQYTDQPYNMPPAVTGLRHLAWIVGAADMGSAFYLALAIAAIAGAGLGAQQRPRAARTIDFAAASVATAAMASPLHVYDFTILAPIGLYALALPGASGVVAFFAFALCWRAGNLPFPAAADDVTYYDGSFYASMAASAIAIAILSSVIQTRRRRTPAFAAASIAALRPLAHTRFQ